MSCIHLLEPRILADTSDFLHDADILRPYIILDTLVVVFLFVYYMYFVFPFPPLHAAMMTFPMCGTNKALIYLFPYYV